MKQRDYLILVVTMLIALVMPQDLIAKKIVYMQHQYKGGVSKEQIPQGKGEIDIAGIVIKGIFDGSSITNASFERDWLRYDGSITFNESNRITLKAGGEFTKYYYEENSIRITHTTSTPYVYPNELANNRKSITETLSEDVEIDNDGILNDVVKIPIKTEMKNVPKELNPPVILQEIPIPLFKFNKWIGNWSNNDEEIYLHVVTSRILLDGAPIKDYKDEEGRVWNYVSKYDHLGNKITYKVIYPDGSYCGSETGGKIIHPSKSYYINDNNWRIVYPNGNVLGKERTTLVLRIKDQKVFFVLYAYSKWDMKVEDVVSGAKQLPTLKPDGNVGYVEPEWSGYRIGIFDSEGLSEDDLHNIIKNSVLPCFELPNNNCSLVFRYGSNGSGKYIGVYRNGKYMTNADVEKDDEKVIMAKRQNLNKKYGKAHVDAIANGKLSVGMPLNLLIDSELPHIRPGVTVYKMHVYNNGERGDFKVEIAVTGKTHTGGPGIYYRMYRIWVNNRKITQFREWTNADDREFSLIHR